MKVGDKVKEKYAGLTGTVVPVEEGLNWPLTVEFADGQSSFWEPEELEVVDEA